MLRVLDLFSGIGGFSLGLERTGGFRTVAFCEIEPYCQAVLRKHWPNVPIWADIRVLRGDELIWQGKRPDVICGGFPCQDISIAGRGAGIEGSRSGLWAEYARLIGELRPRYVLVENVAALLGRGIERVLGDLSSLGYDAEWHVISAADVGAQHLRERIWIVADAIREQLRDGGRGPVNGAQGEICSQVREQRFRADVEPSGQVVADSASEGLQDIQGGRQVCERPRYGAAIRRGVARRRRDGWSSEPDVGRVANGVPARVDRLRSLGNAVVPQISEIIGRAILEAKGWQR